MPHLRTRRVIHNQRIFMFCFFFNVMPFGLHLASIFTQLAHGDANVALPGWCPAVPAGWNVYFDLWRTKAEEDTTIAPDSLTCTVDSGKDYREIYRPALASLFAGASVRPAARRIRFGRDRRAADVLVSSDISASRPRRRRRSRLL